MKRVYDYDLIVIGAGIAGMVSAVTANSLGKRVAVVEKSRVGGNCTNLTCIPSKALIRLGHVSRDMAHLERLGLLSLPAGLDRTAVMAHIRDIVQKAYEKDLPETFERIGIGMISAPASFIDGHRIRAGEEMLSARKFIIAAGTSPFIPEIPGLAGIDYLTNESLYKLDDLPRSLIILGGGVDGLEYASAFGRLGVETTVVEMAPRLLPMADGEVVNHLLEALSSEGIRLLAGTKAVALADRQGKVGLTIERQDGAREEILAERVLVAVGRKPDLEGLCLEKAGVEYNARGIIVDNKLRTSALQHLCLRRHCRALPVGHHRRGPGDRGGNQCLPALQAKRRLPQQRLCDLHGADTRLRGPHGRSRRGKSTGAISASIASPTGPCGGR